MFVKHKSTQIIWYKLIFNIYLQEKYPQLAEVILNKDDLVESIFDKYRQITMDNVLEQVKNYINQLQNRINDGTTKNAEP